MKKIPTLERITPISAIDFGRNDGMHDPIEKYFLDTGLIDRLYAGKVSILLGRKGTGKTAVARHLINDADKSWDKWASLLSFRDIPVTLLAEFSDPAFAQSGKYALLWKFIFLIEIGKLVIKDEAIDPDTKNKIEALILVVHPELTSTPGNYLKTTRERGFDLGPDYARIKEKDSSGGDVTKLSPYVESLEAAIKSAARRECKYTCAIDELDDSYRLSPEYLDLVIGLFKAAMDLNGSFSRDWSTPRIVVGVRDDIFRELTYSDKNKWSDFGENLDWVPGIREHLLDSDLFNLINIRIGASLVDIPTTECDYWSQVFTSERVKNDLKPFQYILSRTFFRPRDVIQFCKEIQHEATKLGIEKFDKESILNAEEGFSNWLVEELVDEMHVKLPEIRQILEAFKRHGYPTFRKEDIQKTLSSLGFSDTNQVDKILEIFYDFSIIGQFDGDDPTPIFRYKNPHRRYEKGKIYSIHYGLRSALRLFGTPSRRKNANQKSWKKPANMRDTNQKRNPNRNNQR